MCIRDRYITEFLKLYMSIGTWSDWSKCETLHRTLHEAGTLGNARCRFQLVTGQHPHLKMEAISLNTVIRYFWHTFSFASFTFIPAWRSSSSVGRTLSCNLSSTPVTHNNSISRSSFSISKVTLASRSSTVLLALSICNWKSQIRLLGKTLTVLIRRRRGCVDYLELFVLFVGKNFSGHHQSTQTFTSHVAAFFFHPIVVRDNSLHDDICSLQVKYNLTSLLFLWTENVARSHDINARIPCPLWSCIFTVSYTHLTLPTIYSV